MSEGREKLLVNDTLTVAARLSSVVAAACLPIVAGAGLWIAGELWTAFKEMKADIHEIKEHIAVATMHSIDQDRRLERLESRVFK
jgi:hypothetical protein